MLDHSSGVFIKRHGRYRAVCLFWALGFIGLVPHVHSDQELTVVRYLELLRNPLRISVGLSGPALKSTIQTSRNQNRAEILLHRSRLCPDFKRYPNSFSSNLKSLIITESESMVRISLDFGANPLPKFKLHKSDQNLIVNFLPVRIDPAESVQDASVEVGSKKEPGKPHKTAVVSKQPRNLLPAKGSLDTRDGRMPKKVGPSVSQGKTARTVLPQDGPTRWESPAGSSCGLKMRTSYDSDYEAELDRNFGPHRIGQAECIEIESEKVCFFYDEIFLKYANPKDVIKTIDCIFNLYCPGTGQGGPGGGTEHINTRFIEQNMSPRMTIRDAKDKAKTLKPADDRGFDRIEELRLMPLPEFPRRPYESGVDVKSWRMLRDLDRKDPKLAKIIAHTMVWADEKKRVIFLKDTESRLNQIRRVIKSLDKPSLQVLIQSRIVRANKDWSRGLGIIWGGRNNQVGLVKDNAKSYWGFGGNQEGWATGDPGPSNRPTGRATEGIDIPSTFAVNLPVAVQNLSGLMGLGVQFGLLKPNYITELDFRLQFGESSGNVKIVASPEIQVMDGERATIKNGVVMTLKTSSPNWGTHTELVPVDLKLEVTPKVLFNNRIRMDVDIFDNVVDGNTTCGACDIVKLYLTREAHTTLVVGDGETCVLGGIIREADSHRKQGWPILMDLPVVGRLFSSNTKATVCDELMVFLTPTIARTGPGDTLPVDCGISKRSQP